jgi:prepilin-type processing-associated H-X9-DG protein/prepilin-type N-terminal cleavage/methylation domain-containing protein
MQRSKSRSAFTLVELLVVIGIIALLISILLPSLNAARQVAQSTKCAANLKQISLAFILYANDNHGYLPTEFTNGTVNFMVNGVSTPVSRKWFIGWTSGNVPVPDGALLAPYWGTASISGCPSATDNDIIRTYYGHCDYAYNSTIANMAQDTAISPKGCGVKLVRIKIASEKACVWDSLRFFNGAVDRAVWGYPSSGNYNNDSFEPNVNGRHRGYANVGWADGHVSAVMPYYFSSYINSAGADPAVCKQLHIGLIDTDGNQATDEHYRIE